MDELWKRELFLFSNYSVFNIRQSSYNRNLNPILYYVAGYAEKFIFNFTSVNENFLSSPIFENPCLSFENNRPHFLKKSFFSEEEWLLYEKQIKTLSMEMVIDRRHSVVVQKDIFEELSGIHLSDLKFNKIRGIANTSILKFKKNVPLLQKTDKVQNFLMRIKKGSKRIRRILEKKQSGGISMNILKFSELTDTVIDMDNSAVLNNSWGFSYLSNSTRTFVFKLHNGLLGLNSRVAHFVRNVQGTCTFCDIRHVPDENIESTGHLFFDCESVEGTISDFYTWILNSDVRLFLTRREYFVGFDTLNKNKNKTLLVIGMLVKKFIWDCKLRFTLPRYDDMKTWIIGDINRMVSENRPFREMVTHSELDNLIARIRF
jgi:hypothetical protein